ncbi:MAG: Hsp20/alpha crystallin family protein [Nanoarchaeota archaeon]|nr:Hsp20/alpha crystallin family protein [Nanoarchaeota archaeon]
MLAEKFNLDKNGLGKINKFMKSLDEESKALVLFILRNRHADIRELSNLISAPNDSHTIIRIKDVINTSAENILNKPMLIFEESKIDPVTKNKVLFSWWLNDEIELVEEKEAVDVFDEKDKIRVVTRLSDVKEEDINIDVDNDTLIISTGKNRKKIPLFNRVENQIEKTYKNNVLEVSLKKLN